MPVLIEKYRALLDELSSRATLVAVSKTKPVSEIMELYDLGQRDFGENYVQEMIEKYNALPKDIRWHFIGHLQSNKVKFIAPFVHIIQGVDSFKLLKEINKQAEKNNRTIACLLQIHIAEEETKFGLSFVEAEQILQSPEVETLKNISLQGLMGMATLTENEKQLRKEFQSLKNFANHLQPSSRYFGTKLQTLSMGMTSDYKIALEEGSNMIRIGSAIFGERS